MRADPVRIIIVIILCIMAAACGGSGDADTPDTPGEAVIYLEEAISTIEENWIFADRVDWESVRSEASGDLGNARTPEDIYPLLNNLMRGLSDPHTFFVPPELVEPLASPSLTAPLNPNARYPSGRLLDDRLGVIRLPQLTDLGETAERYRQTGVETIQSLDAASTCGWVVDLRGNRGGRMWSMITAVGPLLGEGEIGAFVRADGSRLTWEYRDGNGIVDGDIIVDGPAYELINPAPPVAVLVDGLTGSAAEGAALAFRSRPDARLFGEPTAGAATAPETFTLSDGAAVVVAGAWMADREGTTFDGPIEPDVPVDNHGALSTRTPVNEDEILRAAIDWLLGTSQCRAV